MRRFINRCIIGISTLLGLIYGGNLSAASLPAELRVDYADYNPLSVVIKKFGWLEQEFRADRVHISWVYSIESGIALKHLETDSVNIASTGSLSSVLNKAIGKPIKAVYVFARPEWDAIVVQRDSQIQSIKELKGLKIAAAPGTDAYLFLLHALHDAGMHQSDVQIIPMSHEEARVALQLKRVDAWAGGHPYAALSQLEQGSRVICRNDLVNSYGVLSISEEFVRKYPEAVSRVIKVYEKARKWALRHPDDLEVIFSDESMVSLPVSKLVLSRCDFSRPIIDRNDIRVLKDESPVLKEEKLIRKDTDMDKVIEELIDTSFVLKLVVSSTVL
ncbi:MAG: aliphatic sulfonate ABC transporter substrate-binding protein [Chlorobiaceae bacterium]|nr:aliphatic sulfonate ABC transporter substrate-binding protein [Chlorobiaceae bacterium]